MSDEFGDLFGEFLGSGGNLKPGRKATFGGTLRYHLGADPNDWSYPGNVKYAPHDYMILVGSSKWTGSAATSGAKEVNFTADFAGEPILMLTVKSTSPLYVECNCQATPNSGGAFEIYWWTVSNVTEVIFHWLAVGPVAV